MFVYVYVSVCEELRACMVACVNRPTCYTE